MSNTNISSTFILKKNTSGNEWINPPSTYYWWVCWAKEKPLLRSDNTALMVEDVWYDLSAGTVKVYDGTQFTPAGVIGNSNNGFITQNVEFRIVDQNTNSSTQTGILSFYGGSTPTRIYQIEVQGGVLSIRNAAGEIVMSLDAVGNATFAKNVTVTGDLFADDVGYDEALINILRVEDRIEHNGNATNRITFGTDTLTIDASGTSILLDDAAMTDKIVITGQTKFINNIDNVPDIYLQNHIHHSGDNNTRIGFPNNDEIALRTNGVDRVFIGTTGNVGVGTITPAYPLDVNGDAKMTTIRDSANSVGTSGQVLSSTGSALQWVAAGGGSLPSAVVRETKAVNVNSAVTWSAGTTGDLQKRQFNVVANSGMSVTVSGTPNWTFTIPTAGTYFFEARATIRTPSSDGQTVYGKLVLNNNTLGLGSVIVGDSHAVGPINSSILANTNWTHHLTGFYAITGSTVFTLDHIIKSQYFAPIGGLASNLLGYEEVYSVVNITKIA